MRARVIELLRGYDTRLLLCRFLEPAVVGRERRVERPRAGRFVLSSGDLILGAQRLGLRTAVLRGEFRHFKRREHLPGAYPVADVDIDMP